MIFVFGAVACMLELSAFANKIIKRHMQTLAIGECGFEGIGSLNGIARPLDRIEARRTKRAMTARP